MSKHVLKFLFLAVMTGSVVFMSGCRSKNPNSGLYGSDGGLYGDPLLSDQPMEGFTDDFPMDGDRSLFEPVFFAYDSSQVNPEEAGKCEAVAQYLNKGKAKGVIVEGHTDERGSRDYNQSLGERRALAVRDYLISLGVAPASIHTKSYGEEMPEAMGHDESAWRQNRRAVFAIY